MADRQPRVTTFNDDPLRLREVGSTSAHDTQHLFALPGKPPDAPPAPAPGAELGKYQLLRRIAQGNMGVVYEALDRDLRRHVALKLLRTDQGVSSEDIARFHIESEAAAKLRHPNIVPVFDVSRHDGVDFYTMELIDGVTFDGWLRLEQRTYRERAQVVEKVARALHHAHENRIIHRDLKPANVIVDAEAEPHVTDFGLARSLAHESSVTMPGRTVGTPAYMSPEQAQGLAVDARSDVWGLGAMLFDALTGRPPFVGESAYVVMTAVVSDEPIPPRRLDRSIPAELEAIALQCLEKEPARRYASAAELADDLRRWLDHEPVRARRVGVIGRTAKRLRKHRLPLALGSAVGLIALAFAAYAVFELRLARADWISVYHRDFRGGGAPDGLEFWNGGLDTPVDPWPGEPGGLPFRGTEWLWVKDVRLSGDVRVTATIAMPEPDGLEICLGSRLEALPFNYFVPAGYSCQFAGYKGTRDFVSRNGAAQQADVNAAVPSAWRPLATQTVTLQRRGEAVELWVDGHLVQRDEDPLPLTGRALDRIGMRTFAHQLRLLELSVDRLALPEKASPLVAGDALVAIGAFGDAVERYRTIARDHPGTATAESALTKAYFAAVRAPAADDELARGVRADLDRDFPDCRYRGRLLELDAVRAWQHGDARTAVAQLPRAFILDPHTRVALRLLGSGRPRLDDDSAAAFTRWLGATTGVMDLDLERLGLGSLRGLEPLRLTSLRASDNRLERLEPLRGMPIERLTLSRNRITDLAPLAGMPLTRLALDDNLVSDLSPLGTCAALGVLDISGNQVSRLDALERLPLDWLECSGNPLRSLAPLAGSPLSTLGAASCGIDDLAPLASVPLKQLGAMMNRIADLAPLARSPVRGLNLASNRISDLSPLAGTALEDLTIFANDVSDLGPLRGQQLKMIDCCDNRITDLAPLAGMPLEHLACAANPLTSLGPLLDAPPPTFFYDGGAFPLAEIARARDRWAADGRHARLAEEAQTLLDARHGDVAALLKRAYRERGHAYLFIPLDVTWEEASARCQALGGHLASIADHAELDAVLKALHGPVCWLGLRLGGEGARWDSGEPLTFHAFPSPEQQTRRGPVRMFRDPETNVAMWFVREIPRQRLPFVIEWDEAAPGK